MENYTGPRTLDGRPAPSAIPTVGSSSVSTTRQAPRRGIATLGSLGQGSGAPHVGHGHAHDDDDDSDDEDYHDEEGEPRDLFAGGEKSALAVQDPRRQDPRSLVNDIIKKAKS
jgi:UBX domain-containing protein 1